MGFTKSLPGDYIDSTDLNPGQEIRQLIWDRYKNTSCNFIEEIDYDLRGDNEVKKAFYHSTVNYVLRRLITSAHYLARIYKGHGDGRIRTEIRSHLKYYTRYEDNEIARLVNLLMKCIENSNSNFNNSQRKFVKKQVRKFDWGCFICGRQMDLKKRADGGDAATADHFWPKTFGGESEVGNLRYICKSCNSRYKKDFLDYTDYHYEEISLIIESFTKYRNKAKNRNYEAAIFSKSNYKCVVCDQPAHRVGELEIGRIDKSDSWHFFNLAAYCSIHKPE